MHFALAKYLIMLLLLLPLCNVNGLCLVVL